MAGAGYKLFNTGDVLTAAQVNTYLQEQTVMVFASSAARTTALTGVLAEGMISYLTDTDLVQYYNGTAWTTINTDQTPLTTKGDLFTFSTTDARLAVGNNGETLVADSSTTTGLRWQSNFAAGKNKIINGDFAINQRGFTSITASNTYSFDRFISVLAGDGTSTITPQTFTPGAAPVSGYESQNFWQVVTSGYTNAASRTDLSQRIEDVRTFAGQTVTYSFWAKAASGTPKIAFEMAQEFGVGGSTSVLTAGGSVTISTSWARYSKTIAIPSLSGKTIGANSLLNARIFVNAGSDLAARADSIGIQNNTFQIWGMQLEAGSVATAFQTATGTLAGELAACMRYCEKVEYTGSTVITVAQAYGTTAAWGGISWTTQKRATPTITQTGTIQALQANTVTSGTTFAYSTIGKNNARIDHSSGTGLVAGNACIFQASGDASLLITAEL